MCNLSLKTLDSRLKPLDDNRRPRVRMPPHIVRYSWMASTSVALEVSAVNREGREGLYYSSSLCLCVSLSLSLSLPLSPSLPLPRDRGLHQASA